MWQLEEEFKFTYQDKKYIVETGFITDLASVPYPIKLWLKPDGIYKESAVIHDFLLRERYSGKDISRTQASRIFLASLRYQEVVWYNTLPLYAGVKLLDLVRWVQNNH